MPHLTALHSVAVASAPSGAALHVVGASSVDVTCVRWLRLSGELDIERAVQLDHVLRKACAQAFLVVLDVKGLTFMDTAGLHVIVDASVRARCLGRQLVVLQGPPHVERLLHLTKCDDEAFRVARLPRPVPAAVA